MKITLSKLFACAGLACVCAVASAQDEAPAPPPAPAVKAIDAQPALSGRTITWTDPEFEKIAAMVTGTWKSKGPVSSGAGGESFEVFMGIAPVALAGVPNALYCELSRADGMRMPYRQLVLSFQRIGGKVRLITHEFRAARGVYPPAYSMWAAPEAFPEVGQDQLVATLMYELSTSGAGVSGKTPHAYPTSRGGAVEMSSEFKVSSDEISLADRGMDAAGKVVWGPAAGAWTTFGRAESPLKVDRHDGGLLSINYPSTLEGKTAEGSDEVQCHYVGYLYDGKVFDTSYDRGQPLRYPFSTEMVAGWRELMKDTQKGLTRRMIIPAEFGYGARGRGKVVPPNATMILDMEILSVTPPPAPVTPVEMPKEGAPADPHGDHK